MSNLNPNQFGNGDRLISTTTEELGGHLIETAGERQARAVRAAIGEGEPIGQRTASVGEDTPVDRKGFYRKEYRPYPGIFGPTGPRSTEYEYQDAYGGTHLQMNVEHRPSGAMYSYTGTGDQYDPEGKTRQQAEHMLHRSWHTPSQRDLIESYASDEPKLFGSWEAAPRSQVYSMFASKKGRAHVGTMLGIAARDAALTYGNTLQSPDDLSPHSARLVQGLKGRGVVDTDAPDNVTNDYDFYAGPEPSMLEPEDKVPEHEVQVGRSTMRQVLRQTKPRKPKETYTQERLL